MEDKLNQPAPIQNQPAALAPEQTNPAPLPTPEPIVVVQKPRMSFPKFSNFKLPFVSKKTILIAVVLVLGLIIISFALNFVSSTRNGSGVFTLESPAPTSSPGANVERPSPYANDLKILEIKERVENLEGNLNQTDLREDTLRIPSLDWNVEF